MSAEETLHDVEIREQQLQSFILKSPEYRKRADRELKRQVTMLYLAIALLLTFQGFFTLKVLGVLPIVFLAEIGIEGGSLTRMGGLIREARDMQGIRKDNAPKKPPEGGGGGGSSGQS